MEAIEEIEKQIKDFNSDNLKEGKRLAEKDKANYETETSQSAYILLINRKQELEREIKKRNEELEKIDKLLQSFSKKMK